MFTFKNQYRVNEEKQGFMKAFIVEGTAKSPYVCLDPDNKRFEIKGRSIPKDADAFYAPVLDWIEAYMLNPLPHTNFHFNLEFFNISSSKRILFVLYKLNEMVQAGFDVKVTWTTLENDEDMFEVGQDYAFMVNVPFTFVRISEADQVLVA